MKKFENIIFGTHAVMSVLNNSPSQVKEIYLLKTGSDKKSQQLLQIAHQNKIKCHFYEKKKFEETFKLQGKTHQGIVAEVELPKALNDNDLKDLLDEARDNPFLILILDGVTDPHNLGACLRSADAFGVDAVIVPKDKSVGITATVAKVACGALQTVPFFQVTNLARCIERLKQIGVWLYGAAGESENNLYQLNLTGPVGIIMGAEGKGLRRLTREKCDGLFAIPMLGTVESLNVSVATGICLSESVRQRLNDN